MIDPTPVGWLAALPILLAAAALLVLPGALALTLARSSPAVALGAGAPLTVSVIVVAGVVAGRAGIAWTAPVALAVVALLWLLAAGVGALRSRGDTHAPWWRAHWRDPGGRLVTSRRLCLAGAVVAAALVGVLPVTAAYSPDTIPQQPDTIFHLGTIQSMVQLRDVSTLHAVDFVRPGEVGFYPAAFHAVSATLVELTGASVSVAANGVALAAGFLVWPLGMLLLARTAFGPRLRALVPAPVAAVCFTAYPTWMLGYGVLWPNLLGQALLPAAVALGLGLLRPRPSPWRAALLAVLLPGLVAAHPGGLVGLVVAAVTAVGAATMTYAVRSGLRAPRTYAALAAGGLVVAGAGAAWLAGGRVSTSMRTSGRRTPEMSWGDALVDVVFSAFRWQRPLWVLGALTLVGLGVLLARRRALWVPLLWVVVAGLYVLATASAAPRTRWLTWPWYNNSPRLASLLVLPAALLVTAALAEVAGWLSPRVSRAARAAVPAALVSALLLVTAGGNASARVATLEPYGFTDPATSWVTRGELAALARLGERIPDDAVVAANPYRGGSWLRLVSGERMLYPSEKVIGTDPDLGVLGERLDESATDRAVCSLAQRHEVDYAITGGRIATSARRARLWYVGVDGVASARGWERVATEGPYTLYRMTRCAH